MDWPKNFWQEFVVLQGLSRKIVSNQNRISLSAASDTIARFKALINSIDENEMPEPAANVHMELSCLYCVLNNFQLEKKHLIKSARLFYRTASVLKEMHLTTFSGPTYLMEECYLKVCDKMFKNGLTKFTGATYYEMANNFIALSSYCKAFYYMSKASHHFQTDFYMQAEVCRSMCRLLPNQPNFQESLLEICSIWQNITKNSAHNDVMANEVSALELNIILFCLENSFPSNTKPSILQQFEGKWESKATYLNECQFNSVKALINAFEAKDPNEMLHYYNQVSNEISDDTIKSHYYKLMELIK